MARSPIPALEHADEYRQRGYLLLRGLFSAREVDAVRQYYMRQAERGERIEGHWRPPADTAADDLVARYPRFDMAHEISETVADFVFHPRLREVLQAVMDDEPVAIWNVFYFKPPGTPGFLPHQDDFWNRVRPCPGVTAWISLDDVGVDNGALSVFPGSHQLGLILPRYDGPAGYVTGTFVEMPPHIKPVPLETAAGDAVIFGGHLVHGSSHNESERRWRRTLIAWYMRKSSTHLSQSARVMDFERRELTYPRLPSPPTPSDRNSADAARRRGNDEFRP